MKVVCIDVNGLGGINDYLTLYKIYDMYSINKRFDDLIEIIDDSDEKSYYKKDRLITLDEFRDRKLEEIFK